MKHLFIIIPILAIIVVCVACWKMRSEARNVPKYQPKPQVEVIFDADEYLRSLQSKKRPFGRRGVHRLLLQRTRQKAGVYLESLEPSMDTIGLEIVNAYHEVMGYEYVPVITSGNDWPYHKKTSKHYLNRAMDFRIKNLLLEEKKSIVEKAQKRVKGRARVIWEKGEAEHLHVELLD